MPQFNQTVGSEGLNSYYSGQWRNTGTADYGSYGGGPARLGIVNFYEMNLTGKKILSVKLAAKTSASGGNNIKYILLFDSKYNFVNTWATGLDHLGEYRGMLSEQFYNNTLYGIDAGFLADSIAAGVNTFVIYHENESSWGTYGYSSNYMKWTSVSITVDWEEAKTACTPPTSFTLSALNASNKAILSWSGASGGTGNDIWGYAIQYRDSTDNKTWGAWVDLVQITAANIEVEAPKSGQYRQFRVQTWGMAGEAYDSEWAICPHTLSMIVAPGAPTAFKAEPALYASGDVTLTWSGAVAGSSAIAKYEIEYATSTDNKTWGAWQAAGTVTSSATSGSTKTTKVNTTSGGFTKYRIRALDANGTASAYKESASIQSNTPPTEPTVNFPPDKGFTYNPTPYLLVTLGTDDDEQALSVTGYKASATEKLKSGRKVVLKRTSALTASGSQTATVKVTDAHGAEAPEVVRTFSYKAAYFTDPTLTKGVTAIKAVHIINLRSMVNIMRKYYGLPALSWAETVTAGVTKLAGWKAHVLELRKEMENLAAVVNGWDSANTTLKVKLPTWIDISVNQPTVDVMNQLREAITLL